MLDDAKRPRPPSGRIAGRRPRATTIRPRPWAAKATLPQPQRSSAPWHFWLVVVMATVYLGWRAVEGVVWLIQWVA